MSRHRLQETVLHQAVLRNYLHVIVCLTEVQGYSECLSEELKDICRHRSGGMFVQGAEHELNLDAQNHQGNTALHIAAMRGNGLMAEALCDAGVTPDGIKNNAGALTTMQLNAMQLNGKGAVYCVISDVYGGNVWCVMC